MTPPHSTLLKCPWCSNDNRLLIETCARLGERAMYECQVCNKKWEVLAQGLISKVGKYDTT